MESASAPCVSCRSPSGAPNNLRVAARSVISCSARRAKPSAAAPTVERKISSVDIATLKPSPGAPRRLAHRHADIVEAQRRQRMRRDHLDAFLHAQARRVGIDHEGRQPARARRLAGAGEHHVMIGDAAVRDPGLVAVRGGHARCRPAPPSSSAPRHRNRLRVRKWRRPRCSCLCRHSADSAAFNSGVP